jgi:hypothetical protein
MGAAMSWRERLAAKREDVFEKCPGRAPPKLTEPPFVGFVSDPGAPFQKADPAARQARANLLALAEAEYLPAALVHRLHDLDVAACVGLGDPQLRTFLHHLHDTATRQAGERPADDTAAILCAHCGPVWAHPSIAAALPLVGGWPRALGCSWCFVRKTGGTIPRPPLTCQGCAHYLPDTVTPEAGMGACAAGNGSHYPMQRHACVTFQLDKEATP